MLASRDRWTRDELLAHQSRALAELRAFALARTANVAVMLTRNSH